MSDYSEFLERYYRENILKLAGEYPDRKTLVIDFTRIEKYDIEVGERFLEYLDISYCFMAGLNGQTCQYRALCDVRGRA